MPHASQCHYNVDGPNAEILSPDLSALLLTCQNSRANYRSVINSTKQPASKEPTNCAVFMVELMADTSTYKIGEPSCCQLAREVGL